MLTRSILLSSLFFCQSVFGQYSGNSCTIESTSTQGTCKIIYECPSVVKAVQRQRRYTRCGFEGENEIVCCPDPMERVTTVAPRIDENSPISQRKCKEYNEAVYDYVYSISLAVESERMKIKVDKCGHKVVPLIVGGEEAKPKEFPHMALVGFDLGDKRVSWSCGGTLLSDEYVLTAGHCLKSRTLGNPKYIRLGDLDLLSEEDDARPETFNITEIIFHPDYTSKSKYNDIGLLRMDRKVKLSPYIRPACLPTTFNGPEKEAIATGWGHTRWAGRGSNHMLKVTLTKFSYDDCYNTYKIQINQRLSEGIRDETQICAGSKNEHRDTCQGDSGGPLQVYHQSLYCMYTVIGVTSFGITCGNVNVPGVYTRVYPYVDWISNIIWKGNSCTIESTSTQGTCKIIYECPSVVKAVQRQRRYTRCGFEGENEIVCCPDPMEGVTTVAPRIDENSPISQRKCKEYNEAVYDYVYSISLAVESERMKIKVDKCGHKVVPLIVGGEEAKSKEFPHMALVGFDLGDKRVSWSCGGTLLSDEYVLTAGHCLKSRTLGNPKYIRLGDLDLLSEEDDARPETFNITEIIAHPDYTSKSKYNDIGLLRMDRKVKLSPYIRPACLPTTFNGPEKEAIATGWGHTRWAGRGSNHMLKVTLTKFSYDDCYNTYKIQINQRLSEGIRDETQICAGSKNEHRDTCQGDSGGPLQVYHQSLYCMYTVIGVTSFGITCGNVNVPGVYTRVYPYVDWISNIIWKGQ